MIFSFRKFLDSNPNRGLRSYVFKIFVHKCFFVNFRKVPFCRIKNINTIKVATVIVFMVNPHHNVQAVNQRKKLHNQKKHWSVLASKFIGLYCQIVNAAVGLWSQKLVRIIEEAEESMKVVWILVQVAFTLRYIGPITESSTLNLKGVPTLLKKDAATMQGEPRKPNCTSAVKIRPLGQKDKRKGKRPAPRSVVLSHTGEANALTESKLLNYSSWWTISKTLHCLLLRSAPKILRWKCQLFYGYLYFYW